MGKTANEIGSCCFAFKYAYSIVYINSYPEFICFYLLFQIRCVLSFKSICFKILSFCCQQVVLGLCLICAFYACLLLHAYKYNQSAVLNVSAYINLSNQLFERFPPFYLS